MSSNKALWGGIAVATLAGISFVVLQATKSTHPQVPGSGGAASAARPGACNPQRESCLPKLAWTDVNGTAIPAESLEGKLVVVNFWATWCKPCQKEIPDFNRVYTKFKDHGVVFLGVMTDNPPPGILLNFMSDYEMTYPVVPATEPMLQAFEYPDAIPATYWFDRRGQRRGMHRGALDAETLIAELRKLDGTLP